MHKEFRNNSNPSELTEHGVVASVSRIGPAQQHSQGRQQYRTDQSQLHQQQLQSELIASILITSLAAVMFWQVVPFPLITGWAFSVLACIGGRSLLISNDKSPDKRDHFRGWDKHYVFGALLSGVCWGSLGIIAALYGSLIHQAIVLLMLAGISLTAYTSMQLSPMTLFAFIMPALLPSCAWFGYSGGPLGAILFVMPLIFAWVTLSSSIRMHKVLQRSFNLGSHNTELIKNLVSTRETAEKSKKYAETINLELQEQIHERKQAEEKIRDSEQRMSAILGSIQDTIYQTDMDGVIQWATPSVRKLIGYDVEELLGRNIKEFYVAPEDHAELKQSLTLNGGHLQNFETRLRHRDGTQIWITENSHFSYDWRSAASGVEASGIEGTIRDTTALNKAREALQLEKERAQVTLGSIGDGVITTDLDGNIEYMNTVAEQSTGWKLEDARSKPILGVFRVVDERSLQPPPDPCIRCLDENTSITMAGYLLLIHRFRNQRISIEVNASPIRDANANITGVVLVFHNVTELRGLAKKMSYQATHDSLTGLLNRREFENRLSLAIQRTLKDGCEHALCYMDLDNFKVVNDTCGHNAGDELLKQLTIRLRMELREADTFARLGGDEFGILLEGCSVENAKDTAEAIRRVVENFRFARDNKTFRIGVSVGLVPINETSGTLTEILSAADSACYVAKEQGRNRIHIYEPDDEAVAERHGQMQWIHRIQNVLEENRFRLFFQPIAKLKRGPLESVSLHGEVLLRMLDENNRLVGPGSFIPAAERYLLMPAIDRWVVTNTFRMLTLNKKRVEEHMSTCCINLSGQSLSDERFMDFLVNEIRESGIMPRMLCFEITETAVIANLSNASRFISTLREMGCRFALDDFGVGLSSFGYLKNLAVDYLKLDGCFVQNMVADNIDLAMVEAINQIGHTMDIKTIAEFVEDGETLEAVRAIGVDYAQGYVISKPVPIEIALCSEPVDYATTDGQVPQLKTVS
jgi:diguanylate cyclase (GGDEF)-like protein/PAS domain S-box-containing protein